MKLVWFALYFVQILIYIYLFPVLKNANFYPSHTANVLYCKVLSSTKPDDLTLISWLVAVQITHSNKILAWQLPTI